MSVYANIFGAIYDPFLAWGERAGMGELRRSVLGDAQGEVLEIGAGTGLNLPAYPADVRLTLAEPEEPMARRLRRRVHAAGHDAEVVSAPAESLPFDGDSFDTVVSTLVLCTVPDTRSALHELRRVLRPGGRLVLIEHVRGDGTLGRWQDALHKPWWHFGHGCHCNRDTRTELEQAGFDTAELRSARWPRMPTIVAPLIAGSAALA